MARTGKMTRGFTRSLLSVIAMATTATIVSGCGSSATGLIFCSNDQDCPEGNTCAQGVCRASCITGSDCPEGTTCVSGACLMPCSDDSRCQQGEYCKDGFCQPRPQNDGGTDGDGGDGGDGEDVDQYNPDDRDGDGLPNSVEDANGNGLVDPGETDPDNPDTDGDGLEDGLEDSNHNGQQDDGETSPLKADTDGDGIPDGIEDANHNGQVDAGESDPLSEDTDSDGLPDGVEDANANGIRDDGETSAFTADSDGDGIPDGTEDHNHNGSQDAFETDPLNPDTDGDGLQDGVEDANQNGLRDTGETDPLNPDSDGDGLPDGVEDANGNGQVDAGETDPLNPDTDADGLADGVEDANQNGVLDDGETSPVEADTDSDGIIDGIEDANRNGQVDPGETDPTSDDSDSDGLQDGVEDSNHNGSVDPFETDPLNPDTDGDGIQDGVEDLNLNGTVDDGESDPNKPDTDGDGIPDGAEDSNQNGVQDAGETSAVLADSDSDGLTDSQEDCNGNFQYDPGTETDPLNSDTDGDGVLDGDEDRNGDCVIGTCVTPCNGPGDCSQGEVCSPAGVCYSPECSQGETSPQQSDTDGDGLADNEEGSYMVCSTENLKPIDLYRNWPNDYLLALETFFDQYSELTSGGNTVGAMFYTQAHELAGLILSRPASSGANDAAGQEQRDRATISSIATISGATTRSLVTFDGYDAVIAEYTLSLAGGRSPTALAGQIADALAGGTLSGKLSDQGTADSTYHLFTETVFRSAGEVVLIAALSSDARYDEAQLIRMNDITNSTALARAPDRTGAQCDTFATQGNNMVDFIWVIDDSGSMGEEQAAVSNAAQAMGSLLSQTTLDWRIGVTTTYEPDDGQLEGGDFTRDITTFQNRVRVGASGHGYEYGLRMGLRAIERALPCDPNGQNPNPTKLRCDATLIVVILSDEDAQALEDACGGNDSITQCPPNNCPNFDSAVQNFIDQYTSYEATLFAIVGGVPQCPTAYNSSCGYDAVVTGIPGGMSMSICDADQTANVQNIVRAAQGVASTYQLSHPPISATFKVAMQLQPGGQPQIVPRSRTNGFDYDGTQNSLVFYGSWRPPADGLDLAVSYRSFEHCTPEQEVCDGIDNDCDGSTDEINEDSDPVGLCEGDCDDGNPDVFPGQQEACNGIDDDCDGLTDEGFDQDNDGWATCEGDCDDSDPLVHPDASEFCNGIDDDCDGSTDEDFDQDGDGVTSCAGDCDDNDPDVYPGAEEVCDCADNNCNWQVDEGFDQDGDGWTTCGDCQDKFDCDDTDPAVNPDALEICDGKDNDCDDVTDPPWACGR